jgi:F0F1-type ATP synthase membrane subunit b/b'
VKAQTRRILFVVVVLYMAAVISLNQKMSAARQELATLDVAAGPRADVIHAEIDGARTAIFAANSVLMYLVLYLLLWPHIRDALDRGITRACDEQRRAERRLEAAEAELADAKKRLDHIDEEVAALHERERLAGESEAARLRELAATEVAHIEENTRAGVTREEVLARRGVVRSVAGRALDRALEDLQGELDDATRERIGRELIEAVSP